MSICSKHLVTNEYKNGVLLSILTEPEMRKENKRRAMLDAIIKGMICLDLQKCNLAEALHGS